MKNLKFKSRFLVLLLGLLTMCVTQVWGEARTVTIIPNSGTNSGTDAARTFYIAGNSETKVTNASGDAILTWSTIKNSGSGVAYYSAGHWRLYYNSTKGTSIKLACATGVTITKVVLSGVQNYTPTTKYYVDGGDAVSGSWSSQTLTVSNLSASTSFEFANCYSSNTQLRISQIVVTYEVANNDCTAPGTALSITSAATATVGTPLSLTTAGGNGDAVTWSVTNGTGSATVDGSTLNPATAGTVTVKAHQDQNGTTCEQDAEQTITISKQVASFTFSDGYVESITYYVGDQYTLPSTTSTECGDKTFVGWSTTPIIEASPSKPASNYYDKGSKVTLTSSNTFYAVFATQSGSGTEGYNNVTSLTAGKTYVFGAVKAAASSTLAKNTAIAAINFTSTSSWGSYVTITPNASGVIATSSVTNNNLKWTLISITNGVYVFKSGTNYLSLGTGTGASTAGVSTTSANVYLENVNSTCASAFLIHPTSSSTNRLLCNTGSNYGYRMYGSSTNATASMCPYIRFYEYAPGTTYTDDKIKPFFTTFYLPIMVGFFCVKQSQFSHPFGPTNPSLKKLSFSLRQRSIS